MSNKLFKVLSEQKADVENCLSLPITPPHPPTLRALCKKITLK